MKRSLILRYVSTLAFIVGYVGTSLYVDPFLLLFIALATVGYTTVIDVIRIEESEKELSEQIEVLTQINKALVELRNLTTK